MNQLNENDELRRQLFQMSLIARERDELVEVRQRYIAENERLKGIDSRMTPQIGIAKACYEAWILAQTKSDPLEQSIIDPLWRNLDEEYQLAWSAAAQAAIEAHKKAAGETDPKNDLRCALAEIKSSVEKAIWQFEYGGKK